MVICARWGAGLNPTDTFASTAPKTPPSGRITSLSAALPPPPLCVTTPMWTGTVDLDPYALPALRFPTLCHGALPEFSVPK